MKKNIIKGRLGENIATDFLKKQGFAIVEKNWHYSRFAELDIVAFDSNILVFVEVKARTSTYFGEPIEAITQTKVKKIRTAATAYINEHPDLKFEGVRFDAVCIILKNIPEITHFKDIF